MKSKSLYLVILVAGLILVDLSVNPAYGQTPQNEPVKQQIVMYTCPMHPEVIQDKPGKCPKCGMTLVEKKDMPIESVPAASDTTKMNHDKSKMMHDSTTMKNGQMKM